MGQDSWSETVSPSPQDARSGTLLIGVGILWLLLAIALPIYQVVKPAGVEITWETATEQRTAGFNLYRRVDSSDNYMIVNEDQLIDSKGNPTSGAQYSFVDEDVQPGKTYHYMLEEVEFNASLNRYNDEIFEYSVPLIRWWAAILTVAGIAVGIALLVSGVKERKKQ